MLKILNRQSKFNNNSKTYCDDNRMFSFSCSKSGKTWGNVFMLILKTEILQSADDRREKKFLDAAFLLQKKPWTDSRDGLAQD